MPVYRHSQSGKGRKYVSGNSCRKKTTGLITNVTCERRLGRRVFSSLAKQMVRDNMGALKEHISN